MREAALLKLHPFDRRAVVAMVMAILGSLSLPAASRTGKAADANSRRGRINSTIAIARDKLPESFEGLRTISVKVDTVDVMRTLGCICRSNHGEIRATPTRDAQLPFLDPVIFVCTSCRTSVTFFDSSRDGYDGRLNGGASYDQGSNPEASVCLNCGHIPTTLSCDLAYNIDFEEEEQSERLSEAQNYFDAISISATCATCSHRRHIGDWETA